MRRRRLAAAALTAALLGGCAPAPAPPPATPPPAPGGVRPDGAPAVLWSGLEAPWSIARLDELVLVSERDSGRILELLPDGGTRELGLLRGIDHGGEGGLLGIALLADERSGRPWLYTYFTAGDGNRIMRWPLEPGPEGDALGQGELLLDGIPRAGNHNGGRLAFGPDGMLYATTGDAGDASSAQDRSSLAGKILRMTPTGEAPSDNPIRGSLVYSLGHRNPQGLAWDEAGQLWAAEFGQNTWDELNRIEPGADYGWPAVEGQAGDERYVDPVAQWPTGEASPSALAFVDGTFFLAALRGERLWAVQVDPATGEAETEAWFAGEYGRIREVLPGGDGTLWFVTNNTDGRGDPREGDDRVYSVRLAPG